MRAGRRFGINLAKASLCWDGIIWFSNAAITPYAHLRVACKAALFVHGDQLAMLMQAWAGRRFGYKLAEASRLLARVVDVFAGDLGVALSARWFGDRMRVAQALFQGDVWKWERFGDVVGVGSVAANETTVEGSGGG